MFGASALALADLRVLRDPTFRKVAVTAEQWVPLEQVPERTLLPWLAQKRAQGYRRVPVPVYMSHHPKLHCSSGRCEGCMARVNVLHGTICPKM